MFKKILLKSVTLKGFKGFKEGFKFDFSEGNNQFAADNGEGKSSMGDGIAWTFTGRNAAGASRNLNVKNDESNVAETEVVFLDESDEEHTISRRLTKTTTTIKLDGKEISATDLSELVPQELFIMTFNPVYFLQLDTANQKRLITSTLPTISKDDVLSKMKDDEREFLQGEVFDIDATDAYLKEKNNLFNSKKEKLTELMGRKSVLSVKTEIPAPLVFDIAPLDAKKKELEEALIKLSATTPSTEEQKQAIAALEGQDALLRKSTFPKKSELDVIVANFNEVSKDISRIQNETFKEDANPYLAEQAKCREVYQSKYASYQMLQEQLNEASVPLNISCPTCGGNLPKEKIDSLKANQSKKVEEISAKMKQLEEELSKIMEQGKQASSNAEKFTAEQAKTKAEFEKNKAEKLKELQYKLDELKKNGVVLKAERESFVKDLNSQIISLSEKIKEEKLRLEATLKSHNNSELKEHIDKLKSEIKALEKQKNDVMSQNVYVETLQKQEKKRLSDLEILIAQEKTIEEEIGYSQLAISHMKAFVSKRIDMMHQVLDFHLKDVSIRLEKMVKTSGEIKDTFDIEYKEKPLSICSTAENIKAGLEIIGMISALKDVEYPVFLDNAESITKYHTAAKQVIEVRVEEGTRLTDSLKNRRVQKIIV